MSRGRREVLICPEILKLRSNKASIPDFQLASELTGGGSSEECEMEVEYTVSDIPGMDGVEKGVQLENGKIRYKKSVGVMGDLLCEIDIDAGASELTVNERYHTLGRASIDSVPSVGKLLEDVISLQLLMNGYALLHCAGFDHEGETSVLIGLSNTGKTTTTFDVIANEGAKYISDDIAITDGSRLYCCPYALSPIGSDILDSDRHRFYERAARSIPLLDRVYSQSVDSVYDILDRDDVRESGRVSNLFVLSRGEERNRNSNAAQMIRLSNRAEFRYTTNQILLGAQYLGYGIDIHRAEDTEKDIITDLTSDIHVHRFRGSPGDLLEYVRRNI